MSEITVGATLDFIASLSCQDALAASSPIVGIHHSKKNSSSVFLAFTWFPSEYPHFGQIITFSLLNQVFGHIH